jgi:EmrB/QacA subfamily drug resistance transporter
MNDVTKPGPAGIAEGRAHERRWAAMVVLLIASFMNMIDVTIVNVALPSMRDDLGATESGIEWVVAGYILSFALGLLPFGRYGDIIGKKRIFMLGVGGFTLASAVCGMAANIEMLIAARIIQGVGGAVMTPQVLAIAQVMFPPKERAMAFSLFGLTAGLASVAGPVAGGSLIHADLFGLGWRPIFLINLPIGALALWAGARIIPTIPGNPRLRNDWGGIALAGAAILCLIFPLIEGRGFGWPSWIFIVMALALPLAGAFVWWERRQNALGAAELVPLGLMGNRNFIVASIGAMVFFSALPGFFFVLAVFLQSGYGLDPLSSGITTIPFPVGVLIASLISGRSGGKFARSRIILGAASLIAAMTLLRHTVGTLGDTLEQMRFILPLALGGLGTGLAISPLFQTALAGVPPKDAGSGSGALQSIQQIGGAFGVAIISQIFFAVLGGSVAGGLDQHAAYRTGLSTALFYNIACYGVVALLALLLKPAPQGRHQRGGPVTVE